MAWWPDYGSGMALAVISLILWGSWTVSMKLARIDDNILSLFLLDYCFGMCLVAVAGCLSLGWIRTDADNTTSLENIEHAEFVSIAYAFAAGLVFNVANTLVVVGINIAGMAVAFPMGIGLSLAVGTVLTFAVQPTADPCFMFPGVGLGVLAVVSMGASYRFKLAAEQRRAADGGGDGNAGGAGDRPLLLDDKAAAGAAAEAQPHDDHAAGGVKSTRSRMALIACAVGGVLMGLWSPLSARAQAPGQLSPYTTFLFYVLAVVLSMPVMSVVVQRLLGDPDQRVFRCGDYCGKLTCAQHAWGLLGGVAWAVGTVFNMISGNVLGFAVSYSIGQSAPLMAVVWGLVWREFAGAPRSSVLLLVLTVVLYGSAIAFVALSGSDTVHVCRPVPNTTAVAHPLT